MYNNNTPEIKLCRMGKYAALFVNDAMIEVKDFNVVQTMRGVNEVTITFDVSENATELNFTNIMDTEKVKTDAKSLLAEAFQAVLKEV